jgi:hypothetical protein
MKRSTCAPQVDTMGGKWQKMTAPQDMTKPVDTGYAEEELVKVGVASINPQGKVHPTRDNSRTTPHAPPHTHDRTRTRAHH